MAIETLLITRADIEKVYPIGKNINDDRLDTYIQRAQQSDLKPFLGAPMYWELFNSATDPEIIDLMDGVEYEWDGKTIFWNGLKQLLAIYAHRRLIQKNSTFVTRGGVVRKETEESSQETDPQIQQGGRDSRSDAGRMEREALQFLDNKRTDYPAWNNTAQKNEGLKSGFRIDII